MATILSEVERFFFRCLSCFSKHKCSFYPGDSEASKLTKKLIKKESSGKKDGE